MALGSGHRGRHRPPAGSPSRLTNRNSPTDQEGEDPGPWNPRPPGATAGQPATAGTRNQPPAEQIRQPRQGAKDRG
jgi:hypothetical protein